MKHYVIICFFILFSFGSNSPALAHPHSFIDLKAQFKDDGENVTAISMQWRLDTIASSGILYDLLDKQVDDPEWHEQANMMMTNVIENSYFTEIYRNNIPIQLDNKITDYQLTRDDLQIVLSFTVNFKQAQPVAGSRYQLITFEPTFYVDMTYPSITDITLSPIMFKRKCDMSLSTPEPSDDIQAYALALDFDVTPDDSVKLGQQFAQQVNITCPE